MTTVRATSICLVAAFGLGCFTNAWGQQFQWRTLDGLGNNQANPTWGQVGTNYARVAPSNYADGVGAMVDGPNVRYISNRIFNDIHQNVFSQNEVSQFSFAWGQFMDHTFGLRDDVGTAEHIPFNSGTPDPLEEFQSDSGAISFTRTAISPGSGSDASNPYQQVNTVSSYIDGWSVYGGTESRLEWLREGPVDGDMTNNSALLLMDSSDYLPLASARGDVASAPLMELGGRLTGAPQNAVVAGDIRANENIGLTAMHTVFAREHNRIVSALPSGLDEEVKFQIARKLVGATQQYITYTEFLPAMGVELASYAGYDPAVNASLTNEFAVVGYRAHSIIHGEIEMDIATDTYSQAVLDDLAAQGVEIEAEGDGLAIAVPLNLAFQNPQLLGTLGLESVLSGLSAEAMYKNDEQIDNQLRSVLFQLPVNPATGELCEPLDGGGLAACFNEVLDLGAIDILRGRDHGIPSYNDLREAYGLSRVTSFMEITGESSEDFPVHPDIDAADPINDPDILTFTELLNADGMPDEDEPIEATRASPLAARLKAIYSDVDEVDAFVGMVSEEHLPDADMGELQLAIWAHQFEALRDGDSFFYLNDPDLVMIEQLYGLTYERTLAEVIADNTGLNRRDLPGNVFIVGSAPIPEPSSLALLVASLAAAIGVGRFRSRS